VLGFSCGQVTVANRSARPGLAAAAAKAAANPLSNGPQDHLREPTLEEPHYLISHKLQRNESTGRYSILGECVSCLEHAPKHSSRAVTRAPAERGSKDRSKDTESAIIISNCSLYLGCSMRLYIFIICVEHCKALPGCVRSDDVRYGIGSRECWLNCHEYIGSLHGSD
jgi:hypothetical protein